MAAARVCPLRGLTGGPDTAGSTVADLWELSDPPVRVRTTARSAAIAVSPIAATAQLARDCGGGGVGGWGCASCGLGGASSGSRTASGPAAKGFSPSRARRAVLASRPLSTLMNRPALLALAGTAVLAALARVPYLTAGVGPDEGGYAYVARQWARGLTLYRDVWIDRPQGLLSIYRVIYE